MTETITRKVDMDVEAMCWECGADLNFRTDVDLCGDIKVSASPCKSCMDEAIEKAKEAPDD